MFSHDHTLYSNIPEIYHPQFSFLKTFQKTCSFFQESQFQGKPLEFVIQLFKSGRTNPIIYLQLFENTYLPIIQIKPVIVYTTPIVNAIIAHDFKKSKENKYCFYENVILFDLGTYEISAKESHGVNFYNVVLKGKENDYDFRIYSPKFNRINELRPYMSPEKVKKEINEIIKSKGTNYLFSTNEWITSKLNIKNK